MTAKTKTQQNNQAPSGPVAIGPREDLSEPLFGQVKQKILLVTSDEPPQVSRTHRKLLPLLASLLAVLFPFPLTPAVSVTAPSIACVGRVNNLLFARLKTAEGSVRIEARQTKGKRVLRSLSVTNAEGTAPLFGTTISAKPITVRVLPNGRRTAFTVSGTCAPATGPSFGATFVSALVKIVKGERATINLGIALLSFPANTFGFKSALVKITKPDRPAPANSTDAPLLGPLVIDTGEQAPMKPLILEFPFTGILTAEAKAPISAEFIPATSSAGTPPIQLPVSIGNGTATVAIPGPGQITITPKPSPLPPGPAPITGREPGEPDPIDVEPEPALSPPAKKPTKPTQTKSKGGLLLVSVGTLGRQGPVAIGASPLPNGTTTKLIAAPTDPNENVSPLGWSPDATTFTFVRETSKPCVGVAVTSVPCRQPITSEIWLANADGRNQRFVTNGRQATWAPDGQQLAVAPLNGKGGITIMRLTGEIVRTILTNELVAFGMAWSPDGSTIAFNQDSGVYPNQVRQVLLVNPDGTNLRRLTPHPNGDSLYGWTPSSDQIIVFVSDKKWSPEDGIGRQSLETVSIDGSNTRTPIPDARTPSPGQNCSLWARGGCATRPVTRR
jgi:WD40-like Beta Propeller Repeat